ncbi:DUF3379 family protein [Catenovulum adriaticum]|uniref:DUF3379 domain-containing protein n=1 Tax=Catenovulum adriaticum TaxID=2984846 RepID=A0ABY7AU88_9ALTE|nr:DUF3379 family protein [Catenovulum sp. TS8]WAJ72085.1 DUF3379 domain-containing protein [Catenovulum sp. TS8]
MDDLEFRRQLYASPKEHNSEVKQAILADPNKRQFADEMLSFEQKLEQAYQVDVPDNLASKIILKQTLDKHKQNDKKRSRWHLAIAASIAFMVGLSLNVAQVNLPGLSTNATTELTNLMLEHTHQDITRHFQSPQAMQNAQVSLASINQKLSLYGAQLNDSFGIVRSVNFCQLKNIRALHLIVQGNAGLVNIFIMHPNHSMSELPDIKDDLYKGKGQRYPTADLMYISDKQENLKQIQHQFEQQLKWQA